MGDTNSSRSDGLISLEDQILRVLSASPSAMRASDIANSLDRIGVATSKEQINTTLYGSLSGRVRQDKSYAWLLGEDDRVRRESSEDPSIDVDGKEGRFRRIVSYYLDCLREAEGSEVRAFLGDEDEKFIPFNHPSEWTGGGLESYSVDPAEVPEFAKLLHQSKNSGSLVYGYPLYVDWTERSPTGRTGGVAIPVFLQPVEHSFSSNRITFSLQNHWPRINPAFLEKLFRSASEQNQYLAELGLLMPEGPPPDDGLSDIVRRMSASGLPVDSVDVLDPGQLVTGSSVAEICVGGLHNRAVIAQTESLKFTAGLERELKFLASRAREGTFESNALGVFFGGQNMSPAPLSDRPEIVEVVPVNDGQRAAVASAFENPITVVTGPPGTGKSQVVTNILANAYLNGDSVLFTSRNHKAVDVVEARLNALAAVPLLMRAGSRTGARDLRAELINYINTALATSGSESVESTLDRCRSAVRLAVERRGHIATQLESMRRARNQHELLDARVSELTQGLNSQNRIVHQAGGTPQVHAAVAVALMAIDRYFEQSSGIFARLFPGRDRDKRIKEVDVALNEATDAGIGLTLDLLSESRCDAELVAFRDQLSLLTELFELEAEIFSARRQLSQCPSIPELAEQMAAADELAWDSGADLIAEAALAVPSRLDDEARRDLGAYRATLERLTGDRIGGQAYAKLRREQERLFPKVLSLLPTWCVTNLSASGSLPLADGVFDILVIDEASQCDIPSALPLMYRAKRIVVIGDPMQLSHISSIDTSRDQVLQQRHDLMTADDLPFGYGQNSLFSLATTHASGFQVVNLLDHYRSHEDIVGFSNAEWYQGRLRIATDYRRLNRPGGPAIRWTHVNGKARRPGGSGAVNEKEAVAVVDQLSQLMESGFSGSIGAITPFRAQANRIRDLISKRHSLAQIERFELIVDTAHGLQGDERDVLFFSPVVADGLPDGAKIFLSKTGNLFNVAVTRARSVLHVVGDRASCASSGIPHLERFTKYCEVLDEKPQRSSFQPEVGFWEEPLQIALEEAGLRPVAQHPVNQYRLDLAFPDASIPLDIEVDGELYHKELDGSRCREDLLRDMRMMALGWSVKRFWVYEVRDELDRCVSEIKALLEREP